MLVLRGGAIGDFILTLPALRLLRETLPACEVHVVGYPHIAALALREFAPGEPYAHAMRDIEYAQMARFFARNAELPEELAAYFAGFQQVVSWLFDPDEIFETNLRRAGVKHFLPAYARITDDDHATRQLARPLERMAMFLEDDRPAWHPSAEDAAAADALLGALVAERLVALHPGSGGSRKIWPAERWADVGRALLSEQGTRLIVLGGEADATPLAVLESALGDGAVFLRNAPLPVVGAVLKRCQLFLGHDSGLSHLAGAVGVPSVLLFGPTDPAVWAPTNPQVRTVVAPGGMLDALPVEPVLAAARLALAER